MKRSRLIHVPWSIQIDSDGTAYVHVECAKPGCGKADDMRLIRNIPDEIVSKRLKQKGWTGRGRSPQSNVPKHFYCRDHG